MILSQLMYPELDPVALQLGPVAIRWYSLSYLVGLVGGMFILRARARQTLVPFQQVDAVDYMTWCTLAVLLGGRLGEVLFYSPEMFIEAPGRVLKLWEGGMSFHGGLLGVFVATLIFTRLRKIPALGFMDELAATAPLGLMFGRLANFVNGELWGRPTDSSWGMIVPGVSTVPLHPSQLYEAALEGLALLVITNALRPWAQKHTAPGFLTGVFLLGYALARGVVEFFRTPDAMVGPLTMGQTLSLPMAIIGIWLIVRGLKGGGAARVEMAKTYERDRAELERLAKLARERAAKRASN